MYEHKRYPINKRPVERPIGIIEDSAMLTGIKSTIKKVGAEMLRALDRPSATDRQIAHLYKRRDEILDKYFPPLDRPTPSDLPPSAITKEKIEMMVHESMDKVISEYSVEAHRNSSAAGTSPAPSP